MASPVSKASLNPPEDRRPQSGRPPSPLRNGFVPDTYTDVDPDDFSDEDDLDDRRKWTERSPSPSSSVSHLAASFTQRVGNFLGGMAPRSPGSMLSDAELEAEAEHERDRSRREAERILMREAAERKLVEERVLALMDSTTSLPPPPSRTRTMSNPPSPSSSPKESWWSAAKNKLTPTKDKDKEPLTPAQQIINETKAREKEKKGKGKEERERPKEWPADPQAKYEDPALSKLNIPPQVHRKPAPASPSSPTPSRPTSSNMPPNLTPSPMRASDNSASSPSKEPPLLYAHFNTQGTLDVPATLLTIAKRFEKLEKWTVGHVRALEERMGDVERWLVDKEKEKEKEGEDASRPQGDMSSAAREMQDMKEGMTELQSRVGELGREMAKFATAPSKLSSGPSRQTGSVAVPPPTSSTMVVHDNQDPDPTVSPVSTPHHSRLTSATARESTSPPMASSKSSGTRLPYPTGDYATPPDSTALLQGPFSPPNSPPSSVSSAARMRPISGTGLPNAGAGLGINTKSTTSSPQAVSPKTIPRVTSPIMQGLPLPARSSPRPTSVSPTPRKRYTVALGEPIVSPPDLATQRRPSLHPPSSAKGNNTTAFTSSLSDRSEDEDDEDDAFRDETIGKSSSGRFVQPVNGDYKPTKAMTMTTPTTGSSPTPSKHKLRAQSVYGLSSLQPPQTRIAPLKPRLRTRSTDRLAGPETSFPTGKFVDPLVLRRQDKNKDKDSAKIAMPKPVGKIPIGDLVAFFDGDKKDKA